MADKAEDLILPVLKEMRAESAAWRAETVQRFDQMDMKLNDLKVEVGELRAEVSGLGIEIGEVRDEMRTGFTQVNNTVSGITKYIAAHTQEIDVLRDQVRGLTGRLEKLEDAARFR